MNDPASSSADPGASPPEHGFTHAVEEAAHAFEAGMAAAEQEIERETAAIERQFPWVRTVRLALLGTFATLLLLVIGAMLGARTDAGRAMITRMLDGAPLGSVGVLHVEGLKGDLFSQFSLRKLSIADKHGVWIEVHDLRTVWSPFELILRRVHLQKVSAAELIVHRSPDLQPQPPQPKQNLPLDFRLDDLRLRLKTDPALSTTPGDFDVRGQARFHRNGSASGVLSAHSRTHAGDGITAEFKIGEQDRVRLRVEAREGQGGAIAGALGLPVNKRLLVRAVADGTVQAGALEAFAESGDQRPADMQASWGKDGGAFNARYNVLASKLTDYFVDRIGPEIRITASSHRLHGDVYQIIGQAAGRDARADFNGPLNFHTRRAEGVELKLQVSDLSHWWVPVPKIGPAQSDGALTGDLDHFTYKGAIHGQKIEQSGFTLAALSGPAVFTHKPGEFRLQAELAGQGGGGTGLLAALLGPRPTAVLDGAKIEASGRYVFNHLRLKGQGVDLNADGGQDLFHGLTFNGDAKLFNLATAKPGARGQITATWRASLAREAKLWDVTFNAAGRDFATGAGEFDRLLGVSPKLQVKAAWGGEGFRVTKGDFAGAALTANGGGLIDWNGGIGFDFDWSAKGPFNVGPLVIAGAANGRGRASGAVDAPRADLTAELASVDVGKLVVKPAKLSLSLLKPADALEGVAAIAGPSAYGPAEAKTAFRFSDKGVELRDLVADAGGLKLAGYITLQGAAPSVADLTLAMTPGAFINSGRATGGLKIVARPDGALVNGHLEGRDVSAPELGVSLHHLQLSAKGPLAKLPYSLAIDGLEPSAWSFNGGGTMALQNSDLALTLNGGGKIRRADFKLTEPAELHLSDKERSARLRLAVAGGDAFFDARQAGDVLDLKSQVHNVDLLGLTNDFAGRFNADLALAGKGAHLAGKLDASFVDAHSRDAPANTALTAKVHAELADTELQLAASAVNLQGLKSELNLALPAESAAYPFRVAIDRTKPMRGAFSADGELRPLWDLLAGGDRTLAGRVSSHGTIEGTLNDPLFNGEAKLVDGLFHDVPTGFSLQHLGVNVAFAQTSITVSQFSGADGHGGELAGSGQVSTARGGGSTFQLQLKKFQLINNELGKATASGAVTVTRDAAGHARLAGALTVDRADLVANPPTPTGVVPMDVIEVHRVPKESDQTIGAARQGPLQLALDVSIRASRGVFLRGKGLDAEMSLDSHVGGTANQPDLTGVARVVRGSYDFSGKRFDFDEAGVVHLGATPETIRLELAATRIDPTLTAWVKIRGTAAKPDIQLSSSPVLPQDEILSRVLFGVSASQLSPFEAAQLASALASLATGGGFDIIGGLRQFAGLDRLAVGVDSATQTATAVTGVKQATTISGGKYLSDNVYVELTGGGRLGPTAQVELRLRKNLSVISQVGGGGDAQLSVRFRKNY